MNQQQPGDPVKRATRSGVQGYTAATDDELRDIEHDERRIDPNREVPRGKGRAGGIAPMMPMLGGPGGAGAGRSGAPGAAGVGLGPTAVMPGAQPGAPGAATRGVGAGPGGLGSGGSQGGGLGSGPGFGNAGGGTLAAGAHAGHEGIDTDGDGVPDTFLTPKGRTHPGGIHPGLGAPHPGAPDGGRPWPGGSGTPWPGSTAVTGSGNASSSWPASDGAHGPAGSITSDADHLDASARGWAAISDRMASLRQLAAQRVVDDAEFGLVVNPLRQYNTMSGTITSWAQGASGEFTSMSQRLAADANGYRDTASTQVGQAGTIHGEQ